MSQEAEIIKKPEGCRECNFNPGTIACLQSRRDFDCNFDKRRAAK